MLCTLCSDRIRHGAGITQALAVDCSDHKQVDGVGTKTFDSKLGGFDMICYCLPAVAHWLTVIKEEKMISHYSFIHYVFPHGTVYLYLQSTAYQGH